MQPHSGANANEAVYFAWCEPGDKILAMNLGHGGHLTHGSPVTRSAKIYQFIPYGTTPGGDLDYDEITGLANEARQRLKEVRPDSIPRHDRRIHAPPPTQCLRSRGVRQR